MEPTRTRLPTEARQAEIIAAVLQLAAERSPAEITTGDIAKALNLTQGAVFKHFPTKDAIWLAVLDWVEMNLLAALELAAQDGAAAIVPALFGFEWGSRDGCTFEEAREGAIL